MRQRQWGWRSTVVHCILFIIGGLLITKPFIGLFTDDKLFLSRRAITWYYVFLLHR